MASIQSVDSSEQILSSGRRKRKERHPVDAASPESIEAAIASAESEGETVPQVKSKSNKSAKQGKQEINNLGIETSERDAVIALQQLYTMQPVRKSRRQNLSQHATDTLSKWFFDHISDPYPNDIVKDALVAETGLNLTQVNNWFSNKRIRYKRKLLKRAQKQKGTLDEKA